MKLFTTAAIIMATTMLTACSSVSNRLTTEEALQLKASGVINANPDNIIITNKKVEGEDVQFMASVRDRIYHCRYSATLLKQSETVCD